MTDRADILDVSGLNVDFVTGGQINPAVRGLSFTLQKGETLALVGESGCGKSATAQAIMRLLPQDASRIHGTHVVFEGEDLLQASERRMRDLRGNRIAMIFQDPLSTLNPVMTIGDQIAETLVRHAGKSWRDARRDALNLLDQVQIPGAAQRARDYPHLFSGGMRQRVAIAAAIALRPSVLIADEPTTALDVTIQAQILKLIADLQRDDGMSVLFITHDMGVVAEIADRMVVMNGGEALERGETRQIFAAPQHAYTRKLIAAVPKLGDMAGYALPRAFSIAGEAATAPVAPDADAPPLLEIRDLHVRYSARRRLFGTHQGNVHAVQGISLQIRPGETLGLVGESGCGKSTTGRAVVGLIPPFAGEVRIDGKDVALASPDDLRAIRRKVQMIFQDPFASLNPRMTIGAAIAEPLAVHNIVPRAQIADRVASLLQQVGLPSEFANRLPHEFSGGQRQRISIARALAMEPRLIVADESVSALDVSIKAQVINLMLDIQARSGLSYLFISHDMAVVERVSHRVAVMYRGQIVEIGPRASIFSNPQHAYTRKLLAAVPVPDPERRLHRLAARGTDPAPERALLPPGVYENAGPDHFVLV